MTSHCKVLNEVTPDSIKEMIEAAGIDIDELSDQFDECSEAREAHQVVRKLKKWVSSRYVEHPLLKLEIMHIETALKAAKIDQSTSFSAAWEAWGNKTFNAESPKEVYKWANWLKDHNAIHCCDWCDTESTPEIISAAINKGADILVLHLIS